MSPFHRDGFSIEHSFKASLQSIPAGMSVRGFPERSNWGGETHSKICWHYHLNQDPPVNKENKQSPHIHLCCCRMAPIWVAASLACHKSLLWCAPKMWAKRSPSPFSCSFLELHCYGHKESNYYCMYENPYRCPWVVTWAIKCRKFSTAGSITNGSQFLSSSLEVLYQIQPGAEGCCLCLWIDPRSGTEKKFLPFYML